MIGNLKQEVEPRGGLYRLDCRLAPLVGIEYGESFRPIIAQSQIVRLGIDLDALRPSQALGPSLSFREITTSD
jgi:hypothetical protein